MATVTGYTAAKMQQIINATITAAAIVAGHLILTKGDGSQVDLGNIQGGPGPAGPTGPAGPAADLAVYTEPLDDRGNVSGAVSLNVAAKHVWRINPTGAVTISFTNLPLAGLIIPGTLIVANSSYPITWPAGTKFAGGVAPVLSGETFLSMVSRSTEVTVGVAWSGVA